MGKSNFIRLNSLLFILVQNPSANNEHVLLLKSQLETIRSWYPNSKQPNVYLLGDFNYGGIDWDDYINKDTGLCLNGSDGETFIDILNDHTITQLVHIPTRKDKYQA